ncbi:MAG: thiamine pyrophosphate-binding protein, partial [Candidatus Promineifilaceae bacterium]|nr:thiamine pyrophosphate-binding protein [Candidatus Promineifilaceae bacterium]
MSESETIHGGTLVAELLVKHDVPFLFTLCGGHISPIFVAAKEHGIRVVDVRHEATAVFAADAVSRLSNTVGVAAVTAGPGVTNTVTAVKNAQMAQSPVVILGGAAATLLQGRGALQDIDQMALMKPHVKWAAAVDRVRDVVPTLEKAFAVAQSGVPGPVFVELPVDLLYPESVVRELYADNKSKGTSLRARVLNWYLDRHVNKLFEDAWQRRAGAPQPPSIPAYTPAQVEQTLSHLRQAQRPVLVISSQAMLDATHAHALQEAVLHLGIPTYLSGMARGLLGLHPLHMRHKRTKALKEADLILLAGVPCDFRLGYGRSLSRKATLVSVNRSKEDLTKNCSPDLAVHGDAGAFFRALAGRWEGDPAQWSAWYDTLEARNDARDQEIVEQAAVETDYVNPLSLCRQLEDVIGDDSVIIGDGGDFVATASYIVRPRGPLSWLDPGPFGTLGSGAGFALGAKLVRPDAEVWLLYGDGSAGYTIAEFDTFTRHKIPIIAV